jgi:hypothetical protein
VARNWVFNRFCERITDQLLGLTCAFSVDDLSVCGVLEGWGSTIELHPQLENPLRKSALSRVDRTH